MIDTFNERHFSLKELAALLKIGADTARRLVKDDPDVLKFKIGPKKAHTVYSVPESVARRIYNRFRG